MQTFLDKAKPELQENSSAKQRFVVPGVGRDMEIGIISSSVWTGVVPIRP